MSIAIREEDQFGYAVDIGLTYTEVGSNVPVGQRWNLFLSLTNILTTTIRVRAYIVDSDWASGEPSSGDRVHMIAYDREILPGKTWQSSGYIVTAGQTVVARCDTATGLDALLCGQRLTVT